MIFNYRYKVKEVLGKGRFATVYRVVDLWDEKTYVFKHFDKIEPEILLRSFKPKIMYKISMLEHPNLLKIYDFGISKNAIYALEEDFVSPTLAEYNFNNVKDKFLNLVIQICDGLQELHRNGILHKDLKIENILLKEEDGNFKIKLIDYGFSGEVNKLTGTMQYLSPEVISDNKFSIQSDLYSLGVVLYKFVTKKFPFSSEQLLKNLYVMPEFPKNINKNISSEIGNLIIRLLDKYPENRFEKAEKIVENIKKYLDKDSSDLEVFQYNNIFKSENYIIEEDYSKILYDNVLASISNSNGKMISLYNKDDFIKKQVLNTFRFEMLNQKNIVFNYVCNKENKDPVYSFLKECYNENQKILSQFTKRIQEYIEGKKDIVLQSKENIAQEASLIADFIINLSHEKSLIFIFDNAEYLKKETFMVLEKLFSEISNYPIAIIISTNIPYTLYDLKFNYNLKILSLNYSQTETLVKKIFPEINEELLKKIYYYSCGNISRIRDILKNLDEFSKWNLELNLLKDSKEFLDAKLNCLQEKTIKILSKLSLSNIPLSKEFLNYFFDNDKVFYADFIKDVLNNEIFERKDNYYFFKDEIIRKYLSSFLSAEERSKYSLKILNFFQNNIPRSDKFYFPLATLTNEVADYKLERKIRLKLIEFYDELKNQKEAYGQIKEIFELYLSKKLPVNKEEFINDLDIFQKKSAILGNFAGTIELINLIENVPDSFKLYYILSLLETDFGNFEQALIYLNKAQDLSESQEEKTDCYIHFIKTYLLYDQEEEAEKYLKKLDKNKLGKERKIKYIIQKSIYLQKIGNKEEAINFMELYSNSDMNIENENLPDLADFYNRIAELYASERIVEKAEEYYNKALEIWQSLNYEENISLLYSNLSHLFYLQGDTLSAKDYLDKSFHIVKKANSQFYLAKIFVDYAKIYIRFGDFVKSKEYSQKSMEISQKHNYKKLLEESYINYAMALQKIDGYNKYYSFLGEIKKTFPDNACFLKFDLWEKNFLLFCVFTGQFERFNNAIELNKKCFSQKNKEFYNHIQGLFSYMKKDYEQAIDYLNKAINQATIEKNSYARLIIQTRLATTYYQKQEYKKAERILEKIKSLCISQNYKYWEMDGNILQYKLLLSKKNYKPREIIRKLFETLKLAEERSYFLHEILLLEIIIQLYLKLNLIDKAKEYFKKYKEKIKKIINGLPQDISQNIKNNATYYNLKKVSDLKSIYLNDYFDPNFEFWQENLYNLINLDVDDIIIIKSKISAFISKIFSPTKWFIILKEKEYYEVFLNNSIDKNLISESEIFGKYFELINKSEEIEIKKIGENEILIIPLKIKNIKKGFLVLVKENYIPYNEDDKTFAKEISLHLTFILIKLEELREMKEKNELIAKLMEKEFFISNNIEELINDIIFFGIDFFNAERGGFLKDDDKNIAILNSKKETLSSYTGISLSIMKSVSKNKSIIYITNALEDKNIKKSFSILNYELKTICSILIFNKEKSYGILYFDDNGNKEKALRKINEKILKMFQKKIITAFNLFEEKKNLNEKMRYIAGVNRIFKSFPIILQHEFYTPLTAISGNLSLLNPNIPDFENRINIIKQNVHLINRKFKTLKTYYSYENMKEKDLEKEKCNMNEILNETINSFSDVLSERKIAVNKVFEKNNIYCNVNIEAIKIMLENIFSNAIKFSKDNNIINVLIKNEEIIDNEIQRNNFVVIQIENYGVEIDKEKLKFLGKIIYTQENMKNHFSGDTQFKGQGLGVGLRTAYRIAELHKGKIEINDNFSKQKKGVKVKIFLPISEIEK